ncbi:succinate dehydrogenase flavoprotein subunit [Pajaroellobacter abortibovis]|uniref:succinate dehydrogenase n=1 Tax=Pajaroellobacter abortibovis TaxID=1882918 RepID=A0A1L6MYY3_9BACT|nr:succinate dehydrogenase flavoprotein subunit [Pajaroellobacter abortibovis]APS00716.1 succinate dehydrogenase flavoprotein subunit [Pajaroellobacter abortibovis]
MAKIDLTYSTSGKVRRVAVIGGGLAGLATVVKLCEAGVPVDLFSLVPVKRSHSVCAQGGINASVNTKGEGDSPQIHFEETVYGGDFLANQPPVRAMTQAAPSIVAMLDRMGVPFNRTPEGFLDFRRFGGTLYHRTAFSGATTGQQLLYALDEQVRRYETVYAEDARGIVIPGERMVRKFEWWDFLSCILDDEGIVRGLVAQDVKTMEIKAFPADAVCLATGGPNIIFGRSTNSTINTGTAASAVYQQGACYANGEFIQVHPTAIPGADKLRLISESARGEGGRVWVPKDPKEKRAGRDVPEKDRYYFLEEKYPGYGNLVPRDIASRELFHLCFHEKRGIYNPSSEKNENEVYLDVTHLPKTILHKKLAGILEIYEKFVGENPYENPMRIFPAVHYSMGGLWCDFERTHDGLLMPGSPRNQATNLPGLYAAGEVDYQYHGANRLGANSLLSTLYAGLIAGPAIASYRKNMKVSSWDLPSSLFEKAEAREKERYSRLLKMEGKENPYQLHKELGATMLIDCTIERHNAKLAAVLAKIDELEERARHIQTLDSSQHTNASAQFTRHLFNMIVLARVIATGAKNRNESRGAHYKPEFKERNDTEYLRTTLAFHDEGQEGKASSVRFTREFDYTLNGQPVSVTDTVDTSLVTPRARKYEQAGAASAVFKEKAT